MYPCSPSLGSQLHPPDLFFSPLRPHTEGACCEPRGPAHICWMAAKRDADSSELRGCGGLTPPQLLTEATPVAPITKTLTHKPNTDSVSQPHGSWFTLLHCLSIASGLLLNHKQHQTNPSHNSWVWAVQLIVNFPQKLSPGEWQNMRGVRSNSVNHPQILGNKNSNNTFKCNILKQLHLTLHFECEVKQLKKAASAECSSQDKMKHLFLLSL